MQTRHVGLTVLARVRAHHCVVRDALHACVVVQHEPSGASAYLILLVFHPTSLSARVDPCSRLRSLSLSSLSPFGGRTSLLPPSFVLHISNRVLHHPFC